ncbi:MFS transporter [Actinacidiphila soli]|uniref:MFS transporter n=1 Tax=Actinacidiphila soli TaxID=2487275 RepID=UPI0019D067C1|nr:MFS transporter [Actinacidiphila soli]
MINWGRLLMDTRPLRVAHFRRLWVSSALTAVGSTFTAVTVPLQIYDITGSSAYVGFAAAAALGPLMLAALWGGAVADAVDRRRMLLVTNSGIAFASVLLWAQSVSGLRSVSVIFVLIGLQQGCFGANSAARGAVTPRLVPSYLLPSANALESTVLWFGAVAGPMVAGVLLPVVGMATLYLIDAVALGATLWAVWRLPPLPADGLQSAGHARLREVLDGLHYLMGRRILLVAFVSDFIAMFFGMPAALFPQVAREEFGGPAGGGFALGVLNATVPLGAVLAGFFSGTFIRVRWHGIAIIASVCAWGAAMIGFGLSARLWQASAFLVMGGVAIFVLSTFRVTVLQTESADDMRGRLQGVMTMVAAGGPWMAEFAHGTVGAVVGTTWAICGGGLFTVIAIFVAVALHPPFWRYQPSIVAEPPVLATTADRDRTN